MPQRRLLQIVRVRSGQLHQVTHKSSNLLFSEMKWKKSNVLDARGIQETEPCGNILQGNVVKQVQTLYLRTQVSTKIIIHKGKKKES